MNIMRVRLAAHKSPRDIPLPTFIPTEAGARLEAAGRSIPLMAYAYTSKASILTTWGRSIPIQETFWGDL